LTIGAGGAKDLHIGCVTSEGGFIVAPTSDSMPTIDRYVGKDVHDSKKGDSFGITTPSVLNVHTSLRRRHKKHSNVRF